MNPITTNNIIQLKSKIQGFKQHLKNLDRTYTKKSQITNYNYGRQSRIITASSGGMQKQCRQRSFSLSKFMNRYQKQRQNNICNSNQILLQKMINVQSDQSQHNDPEYNKNLIKMRNSFLMTKYHQRKRFLSQIGKQNKILSRKLSEYSSHDKNSQCRNWRGQWGQKIKLYSQNLANKFPKTGFDYRALAEKQIQKNNKNKPALKLNLKRP